MEKKEIDVAKNNEFLEQISNVLIQARKNAKTATRILNSTLIFLKIVAVEIKSKNAVMHNII